MAENKNQYGLALFGVGVEKPASVKGSNITPRTNAQGRTTMYLAVQGMKEAAETFNLKGKNNRDALEDELDKVRLELGDEMVALILKLRREGFTFNRASLANRKNDRAFNFQMVEKPTRVKGPSKEEYAAAFGLTVDELDAKIAGIRAKNAVLDVPTTTTPAAPAPAPAPAAPAPVEPKAKGKK